MFGDEAYICLGVHGQIWVQRPQDTAYLSQFMVQGQTNLHLKLAFGSASLVKEWLDSESSTVTWTLGCTPTPWISL
jgi:hypothetical protein